MNTDKLHYIYEGKLTARTCWSCGSTLSLSDYDWIICERCEEQQPQDFQPTPEEAEDWQKNGFEDLSECCSAGIDSDTGRCMDCKEGCR